MIADAVAYAWIWHKSILFTTTKPEKTKETGRIRVDAAGKEVNWEILIIQGSW